MKLFARFWLVVVLVTALPSVASAYRPYRWWGPRPYFGGAYRAPHGSYFYFGFGLPYAYRPYQPYGFVPYGYPPRECRALTLRDRGLLGGVDPYTGMPYMPPGYICNY